LRFIVPGTPKPKGNVIKGRWGGYHDATRGLDAWLRAVSVQATVAMKGTYRKRMGDNGFPLEMFDGPIMLGIVFVLPAPKTHTPPIWLKTQRQSFRLMFNDGIPPMLKKPDSSKLLRGVEDAMTGIVWHDDSQVVEANVRKRYARPGEICGALVTVTTSAWVDAW